MRYGYRRVSILGRYLQEQEVALMTMSNPRAIIFGEKISGAVKLDRLGGSTLDILTVLQNIRRQGIASTTQEVGTIRGDTMESLTMNLLASFAEFGRALVIDRTQSGRKRAIESSIKIGRKPKLSRQAQEAIRRRYGEETKTALAKGYGVELRTRQRLATRI